MGSISLRDVSVLTPAPLFRNLTFTIGDGDRLGIVAGNGAGKTTLLNCLAGAIEPTSGDIVHSRGLRIGMVAQQTPSHLLDLPLREAVRRGLPPDRRDSDAWRVALALDAFDTPAGLRDQPLRALSGGWQRLALIARAWIAEPDVLLLDEPTNHLDLSKLQLLETWIRGLERQVPMAVASHDRQFLDTCTNRTLFLRADASRSYAHPYTRARHLLAEDDAADEARFVRTSREATRLRQSAHALKNIGINSGSDAARKKSMQMARRADDMEQRARAPHVERSGDIRLAHRDSHARVLVRLDDVTVSTPDGRVLFRTGKLNLLQHDRVVVLGRNGVGKSRFMDLLHRAVADRQGVAGIAVSPSIVPAYIDQDMSQLPAAATPLAFIGDAFRLGDQRSRGLLADAGLTVEMQHKPISRLSPGQRARLGFLALRLTAPDFYLMDEPTSHIDIAGQERLETEILAHAAACVLVSHDRHFIRALGTRFLLVDGGRMTEIDAPDAFHRILRMGEATGRPA